MYSYSVVAMRQFEAFGEEKSAQVFTLERYGYGLGWQLANKREF